MWHFAQPLTNSYAVGKLWCASYPIRPNLVIDAGCDHGFANISAQWEGFKGCTYLYRIDFAPKKMSARASNSQMTKWSQA